MTDKPYFGMKADRQANARASSLKFRKRNGAHSESYLKKKTFRLSSSFQSWSLQNFID